MALTPKEKSEIQKKFEQAKKKNPNLKFSEFQTTTKRGEKVKASMSKRFKKKKRKGAINKTKSAMAKRREAENKLLEEM